MPRALHIVRMKKNIFTSKLKLDDEVRNGNERASISMIALLAMRTV